MFFLGLTAFGFCFSRRDSFTDQPLSAKHPKVWEHECAEAKSVDQFIYF